MQTTSQHFLLPPSRFYRSRTDYLTYMKKQMTVSYRATDYFYKAVPMLRIANKLLKQVGFSIGDKIEVQYSPDQLIIRKLTN
ncbi:MAG: SymE family type I addiction module toxin [bacterium]